MAADQGGRRRIHVEGAGHWQAHAARNPLAPPPSEPAPPATSQAPAPRLSESEQRDALARSQAEVARRVAAVKGRLVAAREGLPPLITSGLEGAARDVAEATRRAADRRDAQIRAEGARFESGEARLVERLWADAERLAPGWAAAPLAAAWVAPEAPTPADWVRVATATPEGLPLLAPLVNHPGLAVHGSAPDALDLVRQVVIRLIAQNPLKHVVVNVFDPKLRGVLSDLSGLRTAHAPSFPPPALDAATFTERLDRCLHDASRNVELVQSGGFRSLTDLWRHRQVPEGILHLVVVLDYPYAVDRALQERLLRLAAVGGPSGVSLLVSHDDGVPAERDVSPPDIVGKLRSVHVTPDAVRLDGHPLPGRPEPRVPEQFVHTMVEGLATSTSSAQGPTIRLDDVLARDFETPWLQDSVPRLSTESLDVAFGRSGRDPLTLSFRTENPPHPNLLVGGAVGQGKSNLLLGIIYGLAARYSPDELEFHLLDFKRGLEFKRFAPDAEGRNWLPHVKVLSLESNQAFGVAVLRHVDDEMERRSRLFKAAGANSLNAYRALTSEPLPRVVLVIDEFHALFEGDDHLVEAAVDLMAKLAKQGRAYGIHLLLASQTTSGVRGLAVKGDSIFAQFPLRLSLKNTPQESQAILSEGNKAAATLTYRGEVVLNRNYGADPEGSNVLGLAAFAEPESLRALQERLWDMRHDRRPLLFVGTDFAAWEAHDRLPSGRPGVLQLLLGRPMAVTNQPVTLALERDTDQTVAVVGSDAPLALGSINALVRAALPQLAAAGGSLVFLDGLADEHAPWLDALVAAGEGAGVPTVRAGRTEVAATLARVVGPRLGVDGPPLLVVGLGLQRAREMDGPIPAQAAAAPPASINPFEITVPDLSFGTAPQRSGRAVLQNLALSGGVSGVHLIGWWSTLRTLEADLGMTHAGIGRFITAGLGRDDLRVVAGVTAQALDGWPRLGLYDRAGDGGLRTVVPFDPGTTFTGAEGHDA